MIIVQLNGGLGNQLFQYALGRRLSLDKNTDLRFDVNAFKTQKREYKLHHFNVAGSQANLAEIEFFLWWKKHPQLARIHRFREEHKPYYQRRIIEQQAAGFDKNILKSPDNVYLMGYWQSEKYFKDIAAILIKDLTVTHPLTGQNLELAGDIKSTEAVSLHVRRGDYATDPSTNRRHGTLPLEYYHRAIDLILQRHPNSVFFIFSDDIPWIKDNLGVNSEIVFVDHNSEKTDYEDLRLMSYCQHHIIANSSFSWWGAWLCLNEDKIVVAPKKWFGGQTIPQDLIPENWITI
jgi:hypothetical protein